MERTVAEQTAFFAQHQQRRHEEHLSALPHVDLLAHRDFYSSPTYAYLRAFAGPHPLMLEVTYKPFSSDANSTRLTTTMPLYTFLQVSSLHTKKEFTDAFVHI